MLQELIKNETKLNKHIPCMLQSVDSTRFMSNTDTITKNMKHAELNISIVTIFWNI